MKQRVFSIVMVLIMLASLGIVTNAFKTGRSEASSPPDVVSILGSWITGTSHEAEPGTDRALILFAHAEDSVGDVVNLLSVTYGGQPMTKVVDRLVIETSHRTYVCAYILDEAGIAAATGDTFATNWWDEIPDEVSCSSVFLSNVNQLNLIGEMDSNGSNDNVPTIITGTLTAPSGDMFFVSGSCGKAGEYTVNNGFTEWGEHTMSNADGVDGYKSATGTDEVPSLTHDNVNLQCIIGFVINAKSAPVTSPPVVTTGFADSITPYSATLSGTLNDLGTAGSVDVSFEYGITSGIYPYIVTAGSPMSAPGAFHAGISGLTPDTTYYFRAKAAGDGNGYGNEQSFATLPIPQHTLATSVDPAGVGSVVLNPAGGTYDENTIVTLTANPADGYEFDHWSGDLAGAVNPGTVFMNTDKSVTAHFVETAPSGPVAYWPFDEINSGITPDIAGSHDGVVYEADLVDGVCGSNLIWDVTENPTVGESSYSDTTISIAAESNYIYVGGRQRLGSTYDTQARWQKRHKSDGSVVWTRTMDSGNYGDWIHDIALNPTTGYGYVATRYMPNVMGPYWHLEQFSLSDGSQGWTITDSSEYGSTTNALALDSQYVYAAGLFDGPDYYWRVQKRSQSDGALIWDKTIAHSSYDDAACDIAVDSSYAYVVGYDETNGDNDQQWRIEKRALSDGSLEWTKTVNPGSGNDRARSIAIDSGYAYIAGYDSSQGGDNLQWRIEKRALSDGSLEWTKTVNPGSGNDVAFSIAIDSGYAYIAGYDSSPGGDDRQWRIEKRALSDGSLEWTEPVNPSSGSDGAHDIVIDSGYAYITGWDNSPGSDDWQWKIEKRAAGKGGNALEFDGIDDYVAVTDSVFVSTLNDFTMSFWFKTDSIAENGFVYTESIEAAGPLFLARVNSNSGGKFEVGIHQDSQIWHFLETPEPVTVGEWYHVLWTKESGVGQKLYLNNVLVDTDPFVGLGELMGSYATDSTIGKTSHLTTEHFDGILDEVRIYNRALSEAEIIDLYNECLHDVTIYVRFQDEDRCEEPISVGFYPPDSPDNCLLSPGSATYYFNGVTTCATTTSGTKAALQVGPIKPGRYDITVDSATSLMNVKRNVLIP